MAIPVAVRAADFAALDTPLLAVALEAGAALPPALAPVDAATNGALGRALAARDFRAGRDELLYLAGSATGVRRVLLVGMGKGIGRPDALRRAAALAARQAGRLGSGTLAFWAGALGATEAEAVTVGLIAGAWRYDDVRTPAPEAERRAPVLDAVIVAPDVAAAQAGVATGAALGEGQSLARTLGMMPGNMCTPDVLADTARDIARRHGMQVTVLGRAEMEAEGMGSFLAVAQGTPQDPKLIVLEYRRGPKDARPVALVGKGLCFDSGGISIKPAASMEWMKYDMCGAAGVLGAMEAIGRLGLRVNVVGLVGSTTNMPSGTAVKPGDVVKSHLGKYIEIINTDAEGRLVLADVLSYARRFDPAAVVDAATLTGACVIALGHLATGVMGSDQSLVAEVLAAGNRSGERGWQLPMWDEYKPLIKSEVADIKNTGGRGAGTITAALFLAEFTEAYPWVHLDIAGTAYSETDLV
ncbi:MAG: leucyl aminopeptidase, partial [Gemmatimonadota bacterium]|nr:leucyl aminopeptidase [Gemmatimonadota bacterium]